MSTSSIGAYEAKTHLPRLLDEVEQGASIIITKHGRAVARLSPLDKQPAPEQAIAALRSARVGRRLDGVSLADLRDEGRR